MKPYCRLQVLLCVGLLALVHGEEICSSSDKCPTNQCCLQKYLTSFEHMICSPLGAEGSECYVPNEKLMDTSGSSFFEYACPCVAGFTCYSDSSSDKGICVRRCSSNSGCPKGECCSTISSPGNRAKRSSFRGICRKFGIANETCYESDRFDDDVNFLCPCSRGLYCQVTDQDYNDLPTGERGVCMPKDTKEKGIPEK